MKCIAVVMMSLAVVASGAVTYSVPLAYSSATVVQQNVVPRYAYAAAPVTYAAAPVSYAAAPVTYAAAPVTYAAAPVTYAAAPVTYAAAPQTTVVQANVVPKYAAPVAYAAPVVTGAVAYSSDDSTVVEAAPVQAVQAAVVAQPAVAVVAQKEARYLAVNRGAVHDAPLDGHTVSQQSLNLEPAAGTV
ncbi:cuticle protein 16.5-like [Sabethes cyaneus]|uniref:cuticle protein 16.5-like n=1 Tax=Sabethes cyaneus TaxID=53552 RepID=UPI00237D8D55|nr:cuticle protein 16.5-like [Sabethes cyaneus]